MKVADPPFAEYQPVQSVMQIGSMLTALTAIRAAESIF
jgi:hypothetical protein